METLKENKIFTRGLRFIITLLFLFLLSKSNMLKAEQATLSPTSAVIGTVVPTGTVTVSPSSGVTTSPTPTSEVTNVNTKEYSGTVTKIDGRKLTVDTSDGTKEVNVPDNVQIQKNGTDSKFEEIKVNDKITFKQSDDGEVLSISVTSAEVFDFAKYAVPIAIGVLLLLALLYYLFSRGSRGKIKTTTEKVD